MPSSEVSTIHSYLGSSPAIILSILSISCMNFPSTAEEYLNPKEVLQKKSSKRSFIIPVGFDL